jgi:hypothetical protein
MQPSDPRESEPDELTIPAFPEAPEAARARVMDSLGPSRSLPARPLAAREHSPLAVLGSGLGIIAAVALFMLPTSPGAHNARALLAHTLGRLSHEGLPLHDVQCPPELKLSAGKSFRCSAQANGTALQIELTPSASTAQGAIDSLHARIDGAISVAEVGTLAALRFGAGTAVTCPHRYWLDTPGTDARCVLRVGKQAGPLGVSRNERRELTVTAPWLELNHASVE